MSGDKQPATASGNKVNTAAIALAVILAISSLSLTAVNFSSTQPIGDYSFMIYQDPDFAVNGLYNAKASNGTICYSSTNCAYLINTISALNVQTRINNLQTLTIQLLGGTTYNISQAISLKSCTVLKGPATIYRNNDATYYAITNNDTAVKGNFNIYLQDLELISGSGGTKSLVYFKNTAAYTSDANTTIYTHGYGFYKYHLENLKFEGCLAMFNNNAYDVEFHYTEPYVCGLEMFDYSYGCVLLNNVNDGFISNVRCDYSVQYPFRVTNGNANQFTNIWITANQHGFYLNNSARCQLSNFWVWSSYTNALELGNCKGLTVNNMNCYMVSQQTDNTSAYIQCTNINQSSFSNLNLLRHTTTDAKIGSFGVSESAACSYNTYSAVVCESRQGALSIQATSNSSSIVSIII